MKDEIRTPNFENEFQLLLDENRFDDARALLRENVEITPEDARPAPFSNPVRVKPELLPDLMEGGFGLALPTPCPAAAPTRCIAIVSRKDITALGSSRSVTVGTSIRYCSRISSTM